MRTNKYGWPRMQQCEIDRFLEPDILPESGKVLEIGTWEGATACEILESRPGLHWLAIDTLSGGHGNDNYTDKQREQLLANAATVVHFNLAIGSLLELRPFLSDSWDVVIIDGDHSYEGCMADLIIGGDMGRILIVHDYHSAREDLQGVKQATDHWLRENPRKKICDVGLSLVLQG